nr:hypothetical protein [Chloroflexota bacterium]
PLQRRDELATDGEGALYAPRTGDNRAEGDFSEHALRFSPYTWMETHPRVQLMAAGGVLAGTSLLLSRARRT